MTTPQEQIHPPEGDSGWSRLQLALAAGLLLALVALAYSTSFRAAWQLDDQVNIIGNPAVRISSLDGPSLWRAMVQDRKQNRPFSNLTFALNYYFNGQDVRGYHAVNLAWHLLAGLAALMSLRQVFRRAGFLPGRCDLAAWAAAAVWAVHPIQTQAVTYIVQRQTVMASALMLCTLAAYLAGREAKSRRPRFGLYFLAALALVLAVGSKEIALVTPVLVGLVELYFFQNFSGRFLRRRVWPLGIALVVGSGLSILYLRPAMWKVFMRAFSNYRFTLFQRLLTEPRVLWDYLGLILLPLPSRLSLEHDPAVSHSLISPWTTLPAILGWLILLAVAIRFARSHPFWSFAGFWYLTTLFLESSFLPLDLMFEHRLYLPSLAVIAPLVAGPLLTWPRGPAFRGVVLGYGLVILVLAVGTLARNRVWQTELGLWRDCVRKAPADARSHCGLAEIYLKAGQDEPARREYERALALAHYYPAGYLGLGVVAERQGRLEEAVRNYRMAIALQPDFVAPLRNLGILYTKTGRPAEGERLLRQAVRLDPLDPQTRNHLGSALLFQGRYAEAITEYDRALALAPDFAEARQNQSYALQLQRSGAPPPKPQAR